MSERAFRHKAVGLVAAALLVPVAGCTGGGDDEDAKAGVGRACARGTYAWSGIEREQKLIALADPITVTKETDPISVHLKPVRGVSYKPHMTSTAAGARAADAIKALGRHLKTEEPLADPSESTVPDERGSYIEAPSSPKGSYYAWEHVELIEADFTYACPGSDAEPVKGHVLSWERTGSGFLPCGNPMIDEGSGKSGAAERIAVRETCPADSPAAKSA
ncbi:hypothetical protein [Streptomyces sp. 2A115]|uniref:hypothetical protein n=1 Tax=Streptomyces sp. 2A115 TaxID=3457439 RepID=UPI003FD65E2B